MRRHLEPGSGWITEWNQTLEVQVLFAPSIIAQINVSLHQKKTKGPIRSCWLACENDEKETRQGGGKEGRGICSKLWCRNHVASNLEFNSSYNLTFAKIVPSFYHDRHFLRSFYKQACYYPSISEKNSPFVYVALWVRRQADWVHVDEVKFMVLKEATFHVVEQWRQVHEAVAGCGTRTPYRHSRAAERRWQLQYLMQGWLAQTHDHTKFKTTGL